MIIIKVDLKELVEERFDEIKEVINPNKTLLGFMKP